MITTPDTPLTQNDTVHDSVDDEQAISQDHALRKRIISKSVLGLISLFMLVPILIVLLSWTQPVADIWAHMADYVLPQVAQKHCNFIAYGDGNLRHYRYGSCLGDEYVPLSWSAVFFVGIDVAASDTCLRIGICYYRHC